MTINTSCKHCGEYTHYTVDYCPKCTRKKKPGNVLNVLGGLLVVVALAALASSVLR